MHHNHWAHMPRACVLQQEKLLQQEACTPHGRVAPAHAIRESLCAATKTQHSQNKYVFIIITNKACNEKPAHHMEE